MSLGIFVLLLVSCVLVIADGGDRSLASDSSKGVGANVAALSALLKKMSADLVAVQARLQNVEKNHVNALSGSPGQKGKSGSPVKRGSPGTNGGGVSYIRWGKDTCPWGADLVYKGYTGGESHLHTGGGTNYLCLTRTPKYLNTKAGFQMGGRVYGAEYEVSDNRGILPSNLHDHEPQCAVCHVKTRTSKLMIPGTYECPAGWSREYYGYLMTEYYAHAHQRDFICVDENAEALPGTYADRDGALLYFAQGTCGSLPCKPYIDGYELTCAVCTK